jgi:hypothetical protein
MPLSPEQTRQFNEDVFFIVRDFFSDAELQPTIDWIDELVDSLAHRLHAVGKISNPYDNFPIETRLTAANRKDVPGDR